MVSGELNLYILQWCFFILQKTPVLSLERSDHLGWEFLGNGHKNGGCISMSSIVVAAALRIEFHKWTYQEIFLFFFASFPMSKLLKARSLLRILPLSSFRDVKIISWLEKIHH